MESNGNSIFIISSWIKKTMIEKNYSHLNSLPIFVCILLFPIFKTIYEPVLIFDTIVGTESEGEYFDEKMEQAIN